MGKSAVLDAMLVNLALQHGWRFTVCSPENQPLQRHAAALMEIWAGQAFSRGSVLRMDKETKDAAKTWLAQHFTFILPDEADCTLPGILDLVGQVKDQHTIDGVVIDPWNELEHRRPAGMSETEYTSQALSKMRRFARFEDVHLWLVAHPTKLQKDVKLGTYPVPTLYDISGSAHFRNKADMGLSVWRDVSNERSATEIHVQKVRFRECGRIGNAGLYFDRDTGRYSEQPVDTHVQPEPEEFKY
jgi:twinkle protein